jgi:hypothetical protein
MQLGQFIHQKSFEKIVLNVRRHPVTFVPTILAFAILAGVPYVVHLFLVQLFSGLLQNDTVWLILVLGGSIYYLFLIIFFFSTFTGFYLDMLIITNDRLLDVDQHGLFARTVSEMNLALVQDITTEIKGFFPTFFNYGNLIIQNAGAMTKFHLNNVENPNKLREIILELVGQDRKREAQEYGQVSPPTAPSSLR